MKTYNVNVNYATHHGNEACKSIDIQANSESEALKIVADRVRNYKRCAKIWNCSAVEIKDQPTPPDLFENTKVLPLRIQAILIAHETEEPTVETCEALLSELKPQGYTFDYGLDAIPHNLRKII